MIAITIGVVVVLAVLFFLMLRGQAQGARALDLVKEHTEAGLARERARLDAQGESLEVVWTTVPMPSGDGDTVVATLAARPSGASWQAAFMVMGEQVMSQNAVARRLLSADGGRGSGGVMTMEDGMEMPMPD